LQCFGYCQQKVAGKLRVQCTGRPRIMSTIGSRLSRQRHPVSNVPLLKPRPWIKQPGDGPGQVSHNRSAEALSIGPQVVASDPAASSGA
jgi:hypothetical protein